MSQPDLPQAWPPPPITAEPPPLRPRRTGMLVLAIGIVVALVAGMAAFAITRGESAEAQPLVLAFTDGDERTYEIHQTMDARISSPAFGDEPIRMDLTQVLGWKVLSVDADGVATIEVTVSELHGNLNGDEIPAGPIPPIEVEIAPDGRILSAGGLSLGGAGLPQGFGFPGMEQLTPILPDEGDEVAVGATWEKVFSQAFPFGEGTIEFTASSVYERNEIVNGREAAVIVTDMAVPLDLTLSFAELLEALGPELAGATGSEDLDALGDAAIDVGGQGTVTQTSSVDLQAEELLAMQSRGRFDVSMAFSGIPGLDGSSADIGFTGTFTQDLELR
jgi:hypothetical protein